mmetsp:Transcript_12122/g.31046  ORF Transcript_12122/g.31046 Transcript_12122/m.31046 type:complete len:224 (+) Transcript_12122:298-969(+)
MGRQDPLVADGSEAAARGDAADGADRPKGRHEAQPAAARPCALPHHRRGPAGREHGGGGAPAGGAHHRRVRCGRPPAVQAGEQDRQTAGDAGGLRAAEGRHGGAAGAARGRRRQRHHGGAGAVQAGAGGGGVQGAGAPGAAGAREGPQPQADGQADQAGRAVPREQEHVRISRLAGHHTHHHRPAQARHAAHQLAAMRSLTPSPTPHPPTPTHPTKRARSPFS